MGRMMNYHYSDRRGAASRFDDREGWEDSRSFRNDGYQFPEEDSDPRYDEDDYSASSPFDDDEMDGDYYPRRRRPALRNRSRKGERKNRGERSHHSSFLLFLRNLTLALSFVLITLIAIYWERLPVVTEKVKTAFLSGRDRITDLVVNHRTAGVTEGPETEKDVSDSDPLDEEIPDELAMIPTTITPSDATGEQVTTEEIVFSEKTPSVGESSGSLSAQKDLPSLSENGRTTHGPLETPMKVRSRPRPDRVTFRRRSRPHPSRVKYWRASERKTESSNVGERGGNSGVTLARRSHSPRIKVTRNILRRSVNPRTKF